MKQPKILLVFYLFIGSFSFAQENAKPSEPGEYTYDTDHNLKIYCFKPENYDAEKKYPAIVVFHGGGWSIGEASWGFSNAQHYASKGMVAFSVQYRLQDNKNGITPYESVLDAQTAIRWLRDNANKFSINKNKIAAYGWSAGAHLAACAAVFENLDAPTVTTSSAPNLLALKSPALSLLLYPNFQQRLGDKIQVSNLSPAEHVSSATPPSIIVIGRSDTVTPLEGSELYHNNLKKLGIPSELHVYDGVGHLFTPSTEPDDGWPNPDPSIRTKAENAMDLFLAKHGYFQEQ